MARTTYRPNHSDVGKYLRHDAKLAAALLAVAEDGKAYARSISPRRSGNYADSFQVSRSEVRLRRDLGSRMAVRLENTSGYAAAVEWGYRGSASSPGASRHRVLGRTLEHLRRG